MRVSIPALQLLWEIEIKYVEFPGKEIRVAIIANKVWLFFIKLNVSYEKWENQFSQVLPVFVSCPVSGDVRTKVNLQTWPVIRLQLPTLLEARIDCVKMITLPGDLRIWLSKYYWFTWGLNLSSLETPWSSRYLPSFPTEGCRPWLPRC